MPEEIENIEARLCAYIDGELDEAARRDIERHLASNPQHRRLMQEMARARELLQDLPRAPAPPEIEEAIHSHLERSILLDDSTAASAPLRISRWPQIVSAAAIILLAAGLGVIVWLVIRPPASNHTTAVNLPPPVPSTAPSPVRMETAEPKTRTEAFLAKARSPASRPAGWSLPRPEPTLGQAPSYDESPNQMGLVAVTPDPLQTELQLRAFLSSRGLHAQAIDLPPQSLWLVGFPQKAFVVRGIDHEQVQSLRRLLDVSAVTTLDHLNSPATRPSPMAATAPATEPAVRTSPASQPVSPAKVDLLVLLRPQPASPPAAPEPGIEPASHPAAAPAFEEFQMP